MKRKLFLIAALIVIAVASPPRAEAEPPIDPYLACAIVATGVYTVCKAGGTPILECGKIADYVLEECFKMI